MRWEEAYAIGPDPVDDDHKHLFELFNRFADALDAGHGSEVVQGFIGDLVDYTEYHFAREEGLMRRHQYPDFEKHKRMHDTFTNYMRQLAQAGEHAPEEIEFLRTYVEMWLSGHILVMDKWFGEFLTEQTAGGGQPAP